MNPTAIKKKAMYGVATENKGSMSGWVSKDLLKLLKGTMSKFYTSFKKTKDFFSDIILKNLMETGSSQIYYEQFKIV